MSLIKSFYQEIINFGNQFQHVFVLALRVYWGYAFYLAGMGKFAQLSGTIKFFSGLGIPFSTFNAYLVAGVEVVGGVLIIAGLAARLAAIPLSIAMGVALFTAHFEGLRSIFTWNGLFMTQSPVSYLIVSMVIFCYGPGAISMDGLIKKLMTNK